MTFSFIFITSDKKYTTSLRKHQEKNRPKQAKNGHFLKKLGFFYIFPDFS